MEILYNHHKMDDCIVEIRNLAISYGENEVLKNISLSLLRGKKYAIIGKSGTGKSSLLKAMDFILPDNAIISGDIILDGRRINENSNIRGKEITFLLQDSNNQFNPVYTIGEQLDLVQYIHCKKIKKKDRRENSKTAMAKAGLDENCYYLYPHQLSGGMLQRANIAIAILEKAPLILLDEPTSGLDITLQDMLLDSLFKIDSTLVYITHSIKAAKKADYIIVMGNKRILECGTSSEIINNPKSEYSKSLIKASIYD